MALAGSEDASSVPAFVEVCVGECPESNARAEGGASRAVLAVPAAVARGSRGVRDAFADGTSTDELPAALLRAPGTATSLVAVRTRFENGRLALSFAPAADAEKRVVFRESSGALACTAGGGPFTRTSPKDRFREDGNPLVPESALELSLPALSLSVVDGAREIAFVSLDGVEARRASGLGVAGGSGALELNVAALQVDDPHPGAAFPVVVWHDPERGPLLRATLTSVAQKPETDSRVAETPSRNTKTDDSAAFETRFPAACVAWTPAGVHLRVHESAMWRLVAFASALAAPPRESISSPISGSGVVSGRSAGGSADARSAAQKKTPAKAKAEDPAMRLELFRISPFAARVTFKPAPQRRPPSVGPALAATLSMLHLDRLRFEVGEFTRRDARARASQLAAAALAHARSEGTKQALAVLASVNHLSNVAGTLERAGETIRGLGELGENDPDADAGGASARRSAVGDAVDELTGGRKNVVTGALVGGGELAAGVLGGVGGIFTKSIAGFKKSGLQGLADGAARGVVGAATSTAAGAVGFAARVVEGVEATVGDVQDGVTEALVATDATALAAAKPRRLPLAVRGDGVVRAWDERDAEGARLLRVAVSTTSRNVVDTLNPLNIGNTLGSFNAPRGRPFAGGRFEALVPLNAGLAMLVSNRHVGVVAVAEERVEWIMAWPEVVAVRVGEPETDPAGVSATDVVVQGRDASARAARKTAACGSAGAAAAAARRVGEIWAAARAAAARRGGGGVRGGGVF